MARTVRIAPICGVSTMAIHARRSSADSGAGASTLLCVAVVNGLPPVRWLYNTVADRCVAGAALPLHYRTLCRTFAVSKYIYIPKP